MASADVKIDIAAEYTGKKAFKDAETSAQKLEKSVSKLGKQLLGVFAAGKLISFGKQAAKAFAADEKAARSLALALANTGNAFATIEVEKFIGDLQRTTGVLDDQLRPAFRTLITATGDVKKSQDALALALDISAGTGKDLGAVTAALAKGFSGQTTALSRLGAGLDKATLKAGNMDDILKVLTDKFKGQALAAAEGYSGQMDRLAVASNNAKEIIGKDLLDSLALLSGPGGISKATGQMEDLATQIGNVVYGIATLTNKIKGLFNIEGFNWIALIPGIGGLFGPGGLFEKLGGYGASQKAKNAGNPAQSPGQRKAIDEALKLQKQQNELKKIDNSLTTRKITLTADQQALEELKKKFDVERIGLFTALNNATDEETKMRIKSLIAIHDNDAALAGKIKAEEEAARIAALLAESLKQSLTAWAAWQAMIGSSFKSAAMATQNPVQYFGMDSSQPYTIDTKNPSYFGAPGDIPGLSGTRGFSMAGATGDTYIINASGIGDQQIASVVQGAIQDLNRYGNSTTYAGAI